MERYSGRVKWFSQVRGYGFIEANEPIPGLEDVKDFWFHYTEIVSDKKFKKFHMGDIVSFIPCVNEKGYFATSIEQIVD